MKYIAEIQGSGKNTRTMTKPTKSVVSKKSNVVKYIGSLPSGNYLSITVIPKEIQKKKGCK
jgi:hypothetical protein